ncbi:MAG: hypothetical protein E7636_05900 [Ruminococcaceae bacterium]|nr:hypothetical protein [Oscillospiraceae bacterium]
MKIIETKLNENQFINRLDTFCRKKERFDRGYNDKDLYVIKRNKNKFWMSKHYASVGRTDGYMNTCLYCSYIVNDNGFVSVKYRFGKLPMFLIPFTISLIIGAFIGGGVVIDIALYGNSDWNNVLVTALFWSLGLGGLIIRSPKERRELENYLKKICETKYN